MNAVKKTAAKKAAVTKKPAVSKTAAPKAKAAKASVVKAAAPKAKAAVSKAAVKAPANKAAQPKPTVKAVSKAPAKAKTASSTAKVVTKAPARPVSKKAAVKAPAKTSVKVAVKAPAKAAVKTPVKPIVKPAAQPAVKTPAKAASPEATKPMVAKPVAPAAAVPQPGAVPRASKASARLAQITVPSMAQAVASTAAKSSYLPTMPSPVISAPLTSGKKNPKLANNWKSKSVDTLTDEEILAMPDSEYMNDVQLAYFKRKLIELKQGILDNAGETTEHLREDTVVVPDPADRATIEEEHALELRTRDRERKLLKKIEQSINLIDAGDYGYCDETGEPIGVGRLLARPTATLSLEAQQRRELKQKMFGD